MIPKIIHYCWVGPGKYPKLIKKCLESWHKQLPNYEFMLWNKDNSPMHVKYVQDAYNAKKYPYAADYIRFWALYNYGGIYLDMDVYIINNFDKLLNCQSFWGSEHKDAMVLGTEVIGAEKGDMYIKAILERYEHDLVFDVSRLEELKCPVVAKYVYDKMPDKKDITILPYDYFYPFPFAKRNDSANFLSYATENTIAIHLWNMSWVSNWVKCKKKLKRSIKSLFK